MNEITTKVPLTLDIAALKAQAASAWLMEQQGTEAEWLLGLLDAIQNRLPDTLAP